MNQVAALARVDGPEAAAQGRMVDGQELAARVRAEMDSRGLSLSAAAREIGAGVSAATLSRFLAGSYEGDNRAVGGRLMRWLRTCEESARRGLSAAGLERHRDLGVSEEVASALALAQATGDIVLIHGRSGAGKSWAAERYCAEHACAWRVQFTGATVTLAGLLQRVSAAVGAGARHVSALAAETACVERLAGRQALLVADEAHHLRPQLLDELRCVRDLSGCGLALIGGDELWGRLAGSGRLDQVVGRIALRLPLGAPPDADALDYAGGVLGRALPAGDRKAVLRAARGPGGLHALRRLLARAWVLARAEGREAPSPADLAAAEEGAA